MDIKKGPTPTLATSPLTDIQSLNEIRRELSSCQTDLNVIVDKFQQLQKTEHAISNVEFQNWVRKGFETMVEGLNTVIKFVTLAERAAAAAELNPEERRVSA